MVFEVRDIERKTIAILKVLRDSPESLGARAIATRLRGQGIELSERGVRYHLRLMDGRGFTRLVGMRDGRVLTEWGAKEVSNALVGDKVGLAVSRIEQLAFRTTLDADRGAGLIPVNVSLFPKAGFRPAIDAMRPAFAAGVCMSDRVAIARAGETLGEITVPESRIGLATVCSVAVNGALLKNGVPMSSRFSAVLQIRDARPLRFVELIEYAGCSLDPSEVFVRAQMTSVNEVARTGQGRVLATFREIPSICRATADEVMIKLKNVGVGGLMAIGAGGSTLCGMRVEPSQVGVVLVNGLNPVAAAAEAGFEAENYGMCTVMEYADLVKFSELALDKVIA